MKNALISFFLVCFLGFPLMAQTRRSTQKQRPAKRAGAEKKAPGPAGPALLPPPPLPNAKKKEDDQIIRVDTDLVTTPVSVMDAASEPATGLVRPKQGISSPRARRGR